MDEVSRTSRVFEVDAMLPTLAKKTLKVVLRNT
jgi:hypothetical protein